jgi:hypothetical protein
VPGSVFFLKDESRMMAPRELALTASAAASVPKSFPQMATLSAFRFMMLSQPGNEILPGR